MRGFLLWVFGVIFAMAFIYASYWLAKNGSYFFFYEDMVQATIREMVKPEYLLK